MWGVAPTADGGSSNVSTASRPSVVSPVSANRCRTPAAEIASPSPARTTTTGTWSAVTAESMTGRPLPTRRPVQDGDGGSRGAELALLSCRGWLLRSAAGDVLPTDGHRSVLGGRSEGVHGAKRKVGAVLRSRALPLVVAVVVLAVGLGVRGAPSLPGADKAGDVVYAVLVVVLLWLLRPDVGARTFASVGLAWCWAVELLQLTAVPGAAARRLPLSRLVLGSGFDPLDLVAYAVGTAAAVLVVLLSRRARRYDHRARHRPGGRGGTWT